MKPNDLAPRRGHAIRRVNPWSQGLKPVIVMRNGIWQCFSIDHHGNQLDWGIWGDSPREAYKFWRVVKRYIQLANMNFHTRKF